MRNGVIDVKATSDAPPKAVFALLLDVSTWPRWGDWETAELEQPGAPDPNGVGAIRSFIGKARTREQVVAVDQDRHLAYILLSGIPIRGYRADVRLAPTSAGGTEISWRSSFRSKIPGLTGLIERRLQAFIADTAVRLARAAEVRTATADPAPS